MRKALIAGTVLILAVAVAACTGDKDEPEPSAKPATSQAPEELVVEAGTYGYEAYGVKATLKPEGDAWTLEISNSSGDKLDAPGLYALDARDGHQVDATVEGSKPMNDGDSETLNVTWPTDFDDKQIGMIVLLMGDDNYGAFIRG